MIPNGPRRLIPATLLALAALTAACLPLAPAAAGTTAHHTTTAGTYATILFSRTETGTATNCAPDDTGTAPLVTAIAPYLASLGMTATGTLETGVIGATTPTCTHYGASEMGSWADASLLASQYGWLFGSATATYPGPWKMAHLTPAQQDAETCGSAAAIDAHGLPGGHGIIDYPGTQNGSPAVLALQENYGQACFAWGRQYAKSGTTNASAGTTPPYWQYTMALNGGACADPAASCYTVPALHGHPRYTPPGPVITQIGALQPGQWLTIQSYILVTGASPPGSTEQWDCTSPNPLDHWTNDNERYCYSDWQQIVAALAANPAITVTSPLAVGVAFGRPASYPS